MLHPNRKCTTIKLQSQITWEYRLPSRWWRPELHHLKKLTHRLTMHIVLPQLYEPFLANRWALYQQNQITTCLALLLVAGIHSGSYQAQFGSLFSVRVMAFISFCLAVLVAEGFLLNALTSSQFSLLSMIFWRKYYIYIQGSREGNSKCYVLPQNHYSECSLFIVKLCT